LKVFFSIGRRFLLNTFLKFWFIMSRLSARSNVSTIRGQVPRLTAPYQPLGGSSLGQQRSNIIPRHQQTNNLSRPQQLQKTSFPGQRPIAPLQRPGNNKANKMPKPVALNLDDVLAEFVVRRPEVTSIAHNSLNVLHESAGFNQVELTYEFTDNSETSVRCQVSINIVFIWDSLKDKSFV